MIQERKSVPGVDGVHDVHIWILSSSIFVLDAHIYNDERDVARKYELKREINEGLEGFRILHSTMEFEHEECTESGSSVCILTLRREERNNTPALLAVNTLPAA